MLENTEQSTQVVYLKNVYTQGLAWLLQYLHMEKNIPQRLDLESNTHTEEETG